jgi:chloramphenicol-sensitive protein RarD
MPLPPVAQAPAHRSTGLAFAFATYLFWGLMPFYFAAIGVLPAFQVTALRVLMTLPLCLLFVTVRREWAAVRAALASPRILAMLAASALMIAGNWLIYVYAVVSQQVFAASLGYYINPLANVAAGYLFLGERLSRGQWIAVALAATGVAVLAAGAHATLLVSLGLAACFCGYGLIRKVVATEALPGLTVEILLLTLPALAVQLWYSSGPSGSGFGRSTGFDLIVLSSGPVTAIPLLLFSAAARRLPYSTLGFIQYLTPTIVFVLGLFVFREPLRPVQLVSFALIWLAVAVFSLDALSGQRRRKA